jgi:long-chain fatty acid transport protein
MRMRSLIAALLLGPAAAFAGGYAIPNESARDLALSQSTVAAQNGPEAAHTNPSALAGQDGLALTANLGLIYNRTDWSDSTLGNASLRPKSNLPPELAASYGNKLPNGMPYGVGLAFLVPAGGSLFWPTGWAGAHRIQTVEQKVYLTELAAAIQPHPLFKLGASGLYYRITETLDQLVAIPSSPATGSLGIAGSVFTFGVSAEIKAPNDIPLTLGLAYRHQAPLELSGNAHFANVPTSFASALQDQGVTERLTVPNDFYAGLAYGVTPKFKLMGSWNLERWVVYRSDTFVGDKGLILSVPRNYRNAWVFRFGGEYTAPDFLPRLTLRGGFLRSVSPQRTDTISPSLTDASSWAFSLGAGYDIIPALRADIAYQLALFKTVTATGAEAFPGSYETHVHIASAGLTYRFKQF